MIQVYFPKEGRRTLTPIIFKEENLKVRLFGFIASVVMTSLLKQWAVVLLSILLWKTQINVSNDNSTRVTYLVAGI